MRGPGLWTPTSTRPAWSTSADGCVALVELRGGAHVQRLVADEPLPTFVTLLDEPEPPESR